MSLKYVPDRVICSVSMDAKNWHTMPDGTKIRLERKYDNFDNKYTQPINAVVVSADNIPEGVEILLHHNSCHDTNRIFNFKPLSGKEIADDIRYFSVPYSECFAWYNETTSEWLPMPGFDFALRMFEPYHGVIAGIEPELVKNVLYVTTGEYAGKVCYTLRACDYQIVFQDKDGREGNVIRFRSSEDVKSQREMEIVAIANDLTKKVKDGKIYVGLTKTDCKPINQYLNDRRRAKQNDTRATA